MAVVIGTAGHIDHGKTTLLRALTGIDADRLPEERRRGMTIDVGYAWLAVDDENVIDFVDVPGHDRLVGNMLVGAGEIDAAMLVVAADDGPRAQTLEHLALLGVLDLTPRLVVVTKADAVSPERLDAVLAEVGTLVGTGSGVVVASGLTGEGIDAVRAAVADLASGIATQDRPPTLAIDRTFTVRGRGLVVTGTLRGGPLTRGDRLRVVPGGEGDVRIREMQVHGATVERVVAGGRVALNLAGDALDGLGRGTVLTADPDVVATDRVLAAFRADPADRSRWRFHAATDAVDVVIGRGGRDALEGTGIVRLARPIAARPGDRFVLRRSGAEPIGGQVVDARPARGISRRRQSAQRVGSLVAAPGDPVLRLDLHGAIVRADDVVLAPDVQAAGLAAAMTAVAGTGATVPLTTVRAATAAALRRIVTVSRPDAASAAVDIVAEAIRAGTLIRDGDMLRLPGAASADAPDPARLAAMDRLEAALAVPAPVALSEAARAAGCPPDAVRALERSGRIVVLDTDLAYSRATYDGLVATAVRLASAQPLTPADFRDATGTSRKYVMAILEDLGRRAILRRTPAGHVLGPKASPVGAGS